MLKIIIIIIIINWGVVHYPSCTEAAPLLLQVSYSHWKLIKYSFFYARFFNIWKFNEG